MPIHENSGESGFLFVRIDVLVPEFLTETQKNSIIIIKSVAKILFEKRSYW